MAEFVEPKREISKATVASSSTFWKVFGERLDPASRERYRKRETAIATEGARHVCTICRTHKVLLISGDETRIMQIFTDNSTDALPLILGLLSRRKNYDKAIAGEIAEKVNETVGKILENRMAFLAEIAKNTGIATAAPLITGFAKLLIDAYQKIVEDIYEKIKRDRENTRLGPDG